MSFDPHNLRDLEALTKAEALLVHRRRRGWSQQEMAQTLGVSMRKLLSWEYGVSEDGLPDVRKMILPLKNGEVCFLYRRRTGMTVNELARDLGCTAYWVTLMERGRANPQTLLEYWEC